MQRGGHWFDLQWKQMVCPVFPVYSCRYFIVSTWSKKHTQRRFGVNVRVDLTLGVNVSVNGCCEDYM